MSNAQDRNIRKYEETCERNRIRALKRVQPAAADGSRREPLAAAAANIKQYNTKQSNIKEYGGCAGDDDASFGKGFTGVPGVGWL